MTILKICNRSLSHFRFMMKNTNTSNIFVGVNGGGCNGLKYYVKPTNVEPKKKDEVITINDINIIVCGESLLYLIGTEIKWETDFMGSGLKFINPNAKGTCGCGETFSI